MKRLGVRIMAFLMLGTFVLSATSCDKVKEVGENIRSGASEAKDDFDNSSVGRGINNVFGRSEITFQANTRFLYSLDGGNTYSQTIQEVPVGETYYLAVEMQVSQSEETNEEQVVVATITIPSTNVVDCYLDDHPGISITGDTDSVTGDVSYDFNIVADTEPERFRVVFECVPVEDGRARVEVVYDDNVSENWDSTGVIRYVDSEDEDDEAEESDDFEEIDDED